MHHFRNRVPKNMQTFLHGAWQLFEKASFGTFFLSQLHHYVRCPFTSYSHTFGVVC